MNLRLRPAHQETGPLRYLRAGLLGLFVLGVLGTGAELLLLEHTEDPWQYVPLVLMGGSLGLLGGYAGMQGTARKKALRVFQGMMLLFVAGGVLGLWLHLQGNMEFELEMYPSLSGWGLFAEAMQGATPALAPGAMVHLGLLGWAYTYRHPALASAGIPQTNPL